MLIKQWLVQSTDTNVFKFNCQKTISVLNMNEYRNLNDVLRQQFTCRCSCNFFIIFLLRSIKMKIRNIFLLLIVSRCEIFLWMLDVLSVTNLEFYHWSINCKILIISKINCERDILILSDYYTWRNIIP